MLTQVSVRTCQQLSKFFQLVYFLILKFQFNSSNGGGGLGRL